MLVVVFLMMAILTGVRWNLSVVLICISFRTCSLFLENCSQGSRISIITDEVSNVSHKGEQENSRMKTVLWFSLIIELEKWILA
jgi:hypothetical protein